MPLVAVVMGSKSDTESMRPTLEALGKLGIDYELIVMSAQFRIGCPGQGD